MSPRAIAALCTAILLIAFAIDLVTPQLFVAAILLDVPIVLSAFAGSRQLTGSLVGAALLANVIAGYVNGRQAGGVWDALAVGDRLLEALSIVLVGWLALAIHRAAERSGAAQATALEAQRERALRQASNNIRASLSEELVERAIVRQARDLSDASRASLFVAAPAAGWSACLEIARGEREVAVLPHKPRAEVQSLLIRTLETEHALLITHDDAMGRLVLDSLQTECAVLLPLLDAGTRFGVVLLSLDHTASKEDLRTIDAFAAAAAIALGQARLFVELAKKNEELAHRSELIRDIVYALSHDLRTPLSAAGMTLRQARAGAYGPMPEPYLEILQRSIAANDELQRLAETLLLVAQYEAGERPKVYRAVDIVRIAREVVEQMEPLAASKDLRVDLRATQEAIVNGDPGELRRVLINLFSNAVTWSRDGGTIEVVVSTAEHRVRVAVADQGFGVPKELREMLFMRFSGEHTRGGGTGLGLYIVRRIIEDHGGKVVYQPNSPEGSVFAIELPALVVSASGLSRAERSGVEG